jgi:hypothetical protein
MPPRRRRTRWRVDSCGTNQYSGFFFHHRASGAPASTNLLDVVVRQGAAILKLLASEDETLLVWGNALLVLDLALHIVDGVGRLNLEGDGLARQGLNEAVAIYPLVAIPSFAQVCSCRRWISRSCGCGFRVRDFVGANTYICTVKLSVFHSRHYASAVHNIMYSLFAKVVDRRSS